METLDAKPLKVELAGEAVTCNDYVMHLFVVVNMTLRSHVSFMFIA